MIEIKDLLSRFTELLSKGEGKKEAIRKVISEVIKVEIDSNDVKIKNGTIYLDIKPIYKNEILMKQEEIFRKLEESLGSKTPHEIW